MGTVANSYLLQLCHTCWIFLDPHPPVIFQLQLLTTWGDPYYIGLNGLEFYDQKHEKISLSENSILSETGAKLLGLGRLKQRRHVMKAGLTVNG